MEEIVAMVADPRVELTGFGVISVMYNTFDDHGELQNWVKDAAKVFGVKLFWGRGRRTGSKIVQYVRTWGGEWQLREAE
ncbi:MAG: hypothetical protein WAV09_03115 [Minisyncoccia bacterium]